VWLQHGNRINESESREEEQRIDSEYSSAKCSESPLSGVDAAILDTWMTRIY
jgi:hypothetical protein